MKFPINPTCIVCLLKLFSSYYVNVNGHLDYFEDIYDSKILIADMMALFIHDYHLAAL